MDNALSPTASRRLLVELADLHGAEAHARFQPVHELLRKTDLLAWLCPDVPQTHAINVFTRLSLHRSILQSGSATAAEIDRAALMAGRLLSELVGDVEPARVSA